MVRVVEYCGVRALAGLSWDLRRSVLPANSTKAQRLTATLRTVLAAPPTAALTWSDRKADIADRKAIGLPAVSRIAFELLPDDIRARVVLVAICEPDAALYTAFILTAGKPVFGPEWVFADASELRVEVCNLVATGGIDAIAASTALDGLDGIGLPRFDLVQTDLDPRSLPVATAGRSPVRQAALLGGTSLSLIMVFALFGNDVKNLISPPPPQNTIVAPKVPAWTGFIEGCLSAHAEEWPSVPGWRASSRGCRSVAPDQPAIAWRTFQLEGGRNLIISQRVAEMMYRSWPHRFTVAADVLSTETDIALEWSEATAKADKAATPLARQAEDAFVGVERSITTAGEGQSQSLTINSAAALQDLLARVARLESFWIDRIEQSERGTELVLRNPPQNLIIPLEAP